MSGKTTGLGDHFLANGYLIGQDVQALTLQGGPALLDVTDITQSAHSRLGGLRSGTMSVTGYSDPAAGAEHAAWSSLPRTDIICSYLRGQAVQNPVACCNAVQLNYDPTRAADGMLTFKIDVQSDAYGLEWGEQLTAGVRTDTTATAGPVITDTAATSYGAQAYVQLTAFTGTSVTITIEQSTSSGGTYTSLMATTAMTGIGAQRLSVSNATSVDQYLKVVTTGTFSSAVFAVAFMRNLTAGVVF